MVFNIYLSSFCSLTGLAEKLGSEVDPQGQSETRRNTRVSTVSPLRSASSSPVSRAAGEFLWVLSPPLLAVGLLISGAFLSRTRQLGLQRLVPRAQPSWRVSREPCCAGIFDQGPAERAERCAWSQAPNLSDRASPGRKLSKFLGELLAAHTASLCPERSNIQV